MVLIFPPSAERTVQVCVLELAVEDEAIRVAGLFWLLILKALEFFEGGTVFVFDIEQAHLVFYFNVELLIHSRSFAKG